MTPKIMIHEAWYHKVISFFAREANCSCLNDFPGSQGVSEIHHFGTQNLFEIRPRNERPMVPKVELTGVPAEPKYATNSKKTSPRAPSKAMPEKTVFLTA